MSSSAPQSARGRQPDQSGYSSAGLSVAPAPEVTGAHLCCLHSWYQAGGHTAYQGEHSPNTACVEHPIRLAFGQDLG